MKKGDVIQDFPGYLVPVKNPDGTNTSLADFVGKKPCIVFFYPKAGTSVCTKEACKFRDEYSAFADAGAEVVGISSDKPEVLVKFAKSQCLNFPLLSDEDGKLRKSLKIKGDLLGLLPGRVTFVFNKTGICVLSFSNALNAHKHVEQATAAVKCLPA